MSLKEAAAKLFDLINPIVKTSKNAVKEFDKEIALVFIDGDHSYKHAKQDFELWFPKVRAHGIMAFHDTMLVDGPKKVEKNSVRERIANRRVLLLKNFFTTVSKANIRFGMPKQVKAVGKKFIKKMQ